MLMRPYNILYIHSHDTGRYIRPYGFAVDTPRLQRLAEEGVVFRNAFCTNPTCSPSRASLVTGMYPHNNGMLGLAHRGFTLNDYSKHIIHPLKARGYRAVLSGVQHIARSREDEPAYRVIGYDECIAEPDEAHLGAAAFLEKSGSQPFFLSVGFQETHRPFAAEHPHFRSETCRPPLPLPDLPEIRKDMAGFMETAGILDAKIGTVLDALQRSNLAEKTIVLATTDHGIAFPWMKCNLTDHGIGVFLMLRLPPPLTNHRIVDSLVSQLDLFPTICDLLQIDPPPWLQGRSLLPLINGQKRELRDEIHGELNFHSAREPMRCVRTRRFKYIKRFDGLPFRVLPNCDDSASKSILLSHGWDKIIPPEEQLIDLMFDPVEVNNLVDEPDYGEILADMRARLQRWMEQTDDPLCDEGLKAPAKARLNDPAGLSPFEPPMADS